MLLRKGNKLYSILKLKCPRCHVGNLFAEKRMWKLKKVLDMPGRCTHCGLQFERETWFFYGAMYVSYGINVALGIALFIPYYLYFFDIAVHWFLIIMSLIILISFPYVTRLSRAIWINIFEKYQDAEKPITGRDV